MIRVPRAHVRVLVLAALVAGAGAREVAAQQQDTLPPPDTAVAPQDTLLPPPLLVPWPQDVRAGWDRAAWTWNRDELAGEGALSLLDLLHTVPGITTFRAGPYLQPETATVFGGGAGRVEVEIDGFVLDPLTGPALDLSLIELAALEQVRIERGLNGLRIVLRTRTPEDPRPFSRIEAGVGEPSANMFRGLLLAPHVVAGPFGFAVERLEGQGAGPPRPADGFATWVKWGILRSERGLQLEWLSNRFNRDPESAVPLEGRRSDLVIRGRTRFAEGLFGEAYAAWSSESIEPIQPAVPDSLRTTLEGSSRQLGLRGALERERLGAEAALRFRNDDALPGWQARLSARFVPHERGDVSLRAATAGWDTRRTTEYGLMASVRAFAGVRLFAEYASGDSGAPLRGDTMRTAPAFTDRTAWRAGLQTQRSGIEAGAALVGVETDSVAVFGLPGDSVADLYPGASVRGWEAWARVPLRGDWLSGSVSYTTWHGGQRWTYLPASSLRAALDLHALPLASGNLEFIGRLELLQRGAITMPPLATDSPPPVMAARQRINAYLQIRIIAVRLFIRFDDMQGGFVTDVPGLDIRGPRLLYGVKWDFWN